MNLAYIKIITTETYIKYGRLHPKDFFIHLLQAIPTLRMSWDIVKGLTVVEICELVYLKVNRDLHPNLFPVPH